MYRRERTSARVMLWFWGQVGSSSSVHETHAAMAPSDLGKNDYDVINRSHVFQYRYDERQRAPMCVPGTYRWYTHNCLSYTHTHSPASTSIFTVSTHTHTP